MSAWLTSVVALALFGGILPPNSQAPAHQVNVLTDISHEFTFYMDGRWGGAYLQEMPARQAINQRTLSLLDLTSFNLVVLSHGSMRTEYTPEDVALLRKLVEEGGGLLMIAFDRVPGREPGFKLNAVAAEFGAEFVPETGSGPFKIAEHKITQGIDYLEGSPAGLLLLAGDQPWETLVEDSAGNPMVAVRQFGKGRVALARMWMFGDKPKEGNAPNFRLAQALIQWLSAGKQVAADAPFEQDYGPELANTFGGMEVKYSSYLTDYARGIADAYLKIAPIVEDIMGVPLSEGCNKTIYLIATGGGGWSSGVALGIGVTWGGWPEHKYPMIEMISHEATHSWVLPFGEPLGNEGIASYVGIQVGKRMGYEEAEQSLRASLENCEKLDPGFATIDVTKPEQPPLHAVYMGKIMYIWETLRKNYGDDMIARYFRLKRQLVKPGAGVDFTADDSVYLLSKAAGEDLFPWFHDKLGIDVRRDRVTVEGADKPGG